MPLPEITQDNVHIFIPLKVAKVTEMLSKDKKITWEEALLEVYNSKVYSVLEKEETKLWYEGPTYLYKELEDEEKS
ncbi:hypothetical protein JHL18_02535 [Clostridium sp. YIM B02505]|uniref:Uncharacterized protein n=1 Tax=Clostridium yunnanense TaxID=2800325 RepID=A0ABS1EJI7_9CLOT|nr:hypothetical protein [Clostridium yunnanense]MBK1809522.1 hypothetical protein [Clostridium yunnanense]